MLILTLKEGETLYVGDEIKVRILKLHSSRVKIGIDAPTDVSLGRAKSHQDNGERRIYSGLEK
jgi:carbon storage regulator